MSKDKLTINTNYLRDDANSFSLPAIGQEHTMSIVTGKCNYYTNRSEGTTPSYICNTYSVGELENTLEKMILPEGGDIAQLRRDGVSVHYLIGEDGTTYQLVPDDKKPWTAGRGALKTGSKLNPDIDSDMQNVMNDHCISIMYVNNGKTELSSQQITNGLALTGALVEEYKIPAEKVLGLGDWAPSRHFAPGPYFPWKELAKNGLGLWSDVERKDNPETIVTFYNNTPSQEDLAPIRSALTELGMVGDETDTGLVKLMRNFNIHYLGKKITTNAELSEAYDCLWSGSEDMQATRILATWTENSQNILDDLLGQSLQYGDYSDQ